MKVRWRGGGEEVRPRMSFRDGVEKWINQNSGRRVCHRVGIWVTLTALAIFLSVLEFMNLGIMTLLLS